MGDRAAKLALVEPRDETRLERETSGQPKHGSPMVTRVTVAVKAQVPSLTSDIEPRGFGGVPIPSEEWQPRPLDRTRLMKFQQAKKLETLMSNWRANHCRVRDKPCPFSGFLACSPESICLQAGRMVE